MVKYICKNCNYRFNSNNDQNECPYCGRNALEKDKSASELLEEIENILEG